jgi:glycosyltransferase involved in cell wall biosynthesis
MPARKPEGALIVTAARLVPWKGVEALVDIVAEKKLWQLVILGDGPLRKSLEKHTEEKNAQSRIQFLGNVSHAEVLGWLNVADVFALNSTYEGLSHTLIEAMMLGVPVVATRVGGNPELIEDGKNGLLVPVGDTKELHTALSSLLCDSAYAKKLGGNAKKSSADFSTDAMILQLTELLSSL